MVTKDHQKGFVQVLPLFLLAIFAIVTFVIANRVQTQQEEIRSRAAGPAFISGGGGGGITPKKTTTPVAQAPQPIKTPAPRAGGISVLPPGVQEKLGKSGTSKITQPTPVTHPDLGSKPVAQPVGGTSQPVGGGGTTVASAPKTQCATGFTKCSCGCIKQTTLKDYKRSCLTYCAEQSAQKVATALSAKPKEQKITRYSYDTIAKACKEDPNGIFLNLSECKDHAAAAVDEQKYNNCLTGAQKQVCETSISTETLDTSDPNNPKCVKKLYGVSPEACQKQLTGYQLQQTKLAQEASGYNQCLQFQGYTNAFCRNQFLSTYVPSSSPITESTICIKGISQDSLEDCQKKISAQLATNIANPQKQVSAQGGGQATTVSSCIKEQAETGFCNEKGEKCKKLSQTIGPNKTPVFVYRFEADASCAKVTPPQEGRRSSDSCAGNHGVCGGCSTPESIISLPPGATSWSDCSGVCCKPVEKAVTPTAGPTLPVCAAGLNCSRDVLVGSSRCRKPDDDSYIPYCCPSGQIILQGKCVAPQVAIQPSPAAQIQCPTGITGNDTARTNIVLGKTACLLGSFDCCALCPAGTENKNGTTVCKGGTVVPETKNLCAENYCAGTCANRIWNGKSYQFCDNAGIVERDFYLIKPGEQCPVGVRTCSCRNSEVPEGQVCKVSATTSVPITAVCQKACGANECRQEGEKITCLIGPKGVLGRWDKYQLEPGERCPRDARREDCFCSGSFQPDGTCVTSSFLASAPKCDNGTQQGGTTCSGAYTNLVQICTSPTIVSTSQYTFAQCGFTEECKNGVCVALTSTPDITKRIDIYHPENAQDMNIKLCGKGYQWVVAPGSTRSDAPGAGNAGHCESTLGAVSDGYVGETTYQPEKRFCSQTCGDVDGCRCSPLDCDGRTYTKFGENCGGGTNGIQQWLDRTSAIFNSGASTGDKVAAGIWQIADLFTLGGLTGSNQAKIGYEQCQQEISTGKRDPNDNCLKEAADTGVNIVSATFAGADTISGLWKSVTGLLGRGAAKEAIVVESVGLRAELRGVETGTVVELGGTKYVVSVDSEGRQVLTKWAGTGDVPKGSFKIAEEDGAPCAIPLPFGLGASSIASIEKNNILGASTGVLAIKPCQGGETGGTQPKSGAAGPAVYDDAGKPLELPAKPLGGGAYADVYVDNKSGSVVKVFRQKTFEDDAALESANNEVIFYQQYGGQANIAKFNGYVYDAQGNIIGYKQELVAGETLESFYNRGGRLTQKQIDQAVADLQQIQEVTDRAHGDLGYSGQLTNPGNIIVAPNGKIRFIDFSGVNPGELTFYKQNELNAVREGLKAYAQ